MCEYAIHRSTEIAGVGVFMIGRDGRTQLTYSFQQLGYVKIVRIDSDIRGGGKVLMARTMEEALQRGVSSITGEALADDNLKKLRLWYKKIGIVMGQDRTLYGVVQDTYTLCIQALLRHNMSYVDESSW